MARAMAAPSHLKSLQALEAALRHGSLKAAAEALSITPAAAGQRIKALEDYLGDDLLVRGRSGLAPTPSLAPALAHLRAAFRELEAASEMLELQRGQEIHVATVSGFAELWLNPRLAAFRAEHPNILFNVNGEGDARLRLGAVDCEVVFGAPAAAADREMLFHDFVLPVGSPVNLRRIAGVDLRDRLEGFPLLHLDVFKDDPAAPDWAAWIRANGMRRTAPDRGMRFQRVAPALEAVAADAGLTLCGLALIRDWLEDGRLALPFPPSTGVWTAGAYQARFRQDSLVRPQVRRFRRWLAQEAGATAEWLRAMATGA